VIIFHKLKKFVVIARFTKCFLSENAQSNITKNINLKKSPCRILKPGLQFSGHSYFSNLAINESTAGPDRTGQTIQFQTLGGCNTLGWRADATFTYINRYI
jgi:hypothetical protein